MPRYVFDTRQVVRYRFPTHTNDLIMDRADAAASEAFLVVVQPGEVVPRHVHEDAEQVFYVPKAPVLLSPLLSVVPLHLFALELASAKGHDVDQPRNLAKSVTVE